VKKDGLKAEFLKTMTQLATAGFGVVAALAWNSAIQGLINRFIAPGSGLRSQLFYALVVTVLAVVVTYTLGKMSQKAYNEENK
jgi:hypothetical protein